MRRSALVLPLLAGASLCACGGAPEPRASAPTTIAAAPVPGPAPVSSVDYCELELGKPPPQPLERSYTGLAAKARCQPELDAIMDGVAHALGVECSYCHLVPDFRALTKRKEVANWMAAELIPALQRKAGGSVWCGDCHSEGGRGVAKILGQPRNESFAIEWMTTRLVEDFTTKEGAPLRCKSCHRGNLGSPEFQRKIILTHNVLAN